MPTPNSQNSLPGLEQEIITPALPDFEAIAASGDRRAFDPNRGVSEAAADQGWGPVEVAQPATSTDQRDTSRLRMSKVPRGNVRGFHDGLPKPEERGDGVIVLTEEQRRRNRAGSNAARAALQQGE